jgi:hypothetical protein
MTCPGLPTFRKRREEYFKSQVAKLLGNALTLSVLGHVAAIVIFATSWNSGPNSGALETAAQQ